MLHLFPSGRRQQAAVSRRQWLTMSALAAGGIAGLDESRFTHAAPAIRGRHAKSCIYLFLCGGPSQPDLWDLKLNAPSGVRTEFAPVATNVPGLHFSELIPRVARHADKLAIIRSMTHSNNDHNGAIAHSLLGQLPSTPGQVFVDRNDHPGLGALVQKQIGPTEPLPSWIVLPRAFETSSPTYKGQSGGFLGSAFDPVIFNKERKGSLSDARLTLGDLELRGDVTARRLAERRSLTNILSRSLDGPATQRSNALFDEAYEMLTSAPVRSAFDLDRESPATRDRYGRNEYGQSLLMARRLVESGVRFVNVFWTFFDSKGCQFNLWDNHGVPNDVCGIDGQLTGRQQITHEYCTPSFDRSFSALLEDLSDRGLLDDTLVAVAGEFGRTPKINQTAGRDHWAHCYTQLLAGGGVRGGSIWGRSDAQGAYVASDPVTPEDFAATVLHAFGIAPSATVNDTLNRPHVSSPGRPITALFS